MGKQKDDDKKQNEEKQTDDKKSVSLEQFENLQSEFNNLQELATRLDSQLKRAVADYRNLEKRVEQGRSELTNWAATSLITKTLPVIAHLRMALKGASEEEKKSGWFRGVELAVQQLEGVLKEEGLDEIKIDPSTALGTGTPFDPALHEAVDTREGSDNMILEVVEKGYTLGGKVIKPARVVVGRKS